MRLILQTFCICVIAIGFVGCTKKQSFPETTPEMVVERFYQLIADGGKTSNREALTMVSDKYRGIEANNFRTWTDSLNTKSTIEILETVLPEEKTADGFWVASVKLLIEIPSSFGDTYTTTSTMNCIFHEDDDAWKIDFMGDTIHEDQFLDAPVDAMVPEEEDI
jgi:hypothetical protein